MVRPVWDRQSKKEEDPRQEDWPERREEDPRQEDWPERREESAISRDMVTKEDAEKMVEQAVARTAEITRDQFKKQKNDDEDTGSVISSKTVQELKNIAGVFNALKEFSANPLQKAIETSVGDMAAGFVKRTFSPPITEQKKDIIDQILNSQFAAGLGAGLGQRAPELVNSLTQNFGKDRVDGWIGNAINRGTPGSIGPPEVKDPIQENIDALLSLDENNPEHIAAYAKSQGDIPIDVAKKMLMIHKDAKIKQMGRNPGGGSGIGVDDERRRNEEFAREMAEREKNNREKNNVVQYKRPVASPAQVMEVPVAAEGPIVDSKVDSKWADDVQQQNIIETDLSQVPQNISQNTIGQDQMALLTDVLQKMSVEISNIKQQNAVLRSDIDEIKKSNIEKEDVQEDVRKEEIIVKDVKEEINIGKENIKDIQDIRYDINNQEMKQEKVEDMQTTVRHIKDIRKKTKEE